MLVPCTPYSNRGTFLAMGQNFDGTHVMKGMPETFCIVTGVPSNLGLAPLTDL